MSEQIEQNQNSQTNPIPKPEDEKLEKVEVSELDKELQLAELQKANLEREESVLLLRAAEHNRLNDEMRSKALKDFYSMGEDEMEDLPLEDRANRAKPATTFWQRTVWYYKPRIQKGKLVGRKIAILVKAGRYVRNDAVPFIEEMEERFQKLNKQQRDALDRRDAREKRTYRLPGEKAWFVPKEKQNTVEVKPLQVMMD